MDSSPSTAGRLMQSLLALGMRIPGDVRIVGMDDVASANLLPVPLTTMHQPCREIGRAAMSLMIEQVNQPHAVEQFVLSTGHRPEPERIERAAAFARRGA